MLQPVWVLWKDCTALFDEQWLPERLYRQFEQRYLRPSTHSYSTCFLTGSSRRSSK